MGVRRSLPLLGWCVGLVFGTWFFHGVGHGALAAPPLDPAAWGAWAAAREPVVATMALLRVVVLGLCWYLVGVTTVGLVGRSLSAARLVRYADLLTLPWLRRLLQQGLGVALAGAMVTGAAGASSASPNRAWLDPSGGGDGAVTMLAAPEEVAQAPPSVRAPVGVAGRQEALPLPLRLVQPGVAGSADPGVAGSADPQTVGPGRADGSRGTQSPRAAVRTHTVRTGDSLWLIAEQEFTRARGRVPTDAELTPYWQAVIDANRSSLPDPDDPDLILPGQRVELPPLAGR